MKKRVVIAVSAILLLALILFLPIPTGKYDDGGTREYSALTYKIVVWNKHIVEVDETGKVLVSYTPYVRGQKQPIEVRLPVKRPCEIETVEELYINGYHL